MACRQRQHRRTRIRLLALTVLLLIATAVTGCGDDIDKEATQRFLRHLESGAAQRAKITFVSSKPFAPATKAIVYLSGTPGRFRADVGGGGAEFSVFVDGSGTVLCNRNPAIAGAGALGSCHPDGGSPPVSELYLADLGPLLWPARYKAFPVESTTSGTTMGRTTECFRVRTTDPHAVDTRLTDDYCFSTDSILMQSGSDWTATEIGSVTDADFEHPP